MYFYISSILNTWFLFVMEYCNAVGTIYLSKRSAHAFHHWFNTLCVVSLSFNMRPRACLNVSTITVNWVTSHYKKLHGPVDGQLMLLLWELKCSNWDRGFHSFPIFKSKTECLNFMDYTFDHPAFYSLSTGFVRHDL